MTLKDLIPEFQKTKPMSYEYRFTIFTPVYNRANTIERVFKSLENQTFKDFELIIINDGSTDNSHKVISELKEASRLNITYVNNNKNKHKMACYFQAIKLAKGEFLLPLDSDDACTYDALAIFNNEYENIPQELKPKISGVTCLCKDQNGNLIGSKFKKQPYFSNAFMRQLEHAEATEKWGFTKTDILRNIQINENLYSRGYIPEGIIWELIAREGFKTKFTNDILRIYYLDTVNAISIQNHKNDAFGMAIYSLCILNWFYKDYLHKAPMLFVKRVFTLLRAASFLKFNYMDYIQSIESISIRILFTVGWPIKSLFKHL